MPIAYRKGLESISGGEVLIYQSTDGQALLDVRLDAETVWLSLNQMSKLFDRDKSVISRHLSKIFKEEELDKNATVAFFATVQDEGGRPVVRQIEFYNLDAPANSCLRRGRDCDCRPLEAAGCAMLSVL
jgi:hypothetical protein